MAKKTKCKHCKNNTESRIEPATNKGRVWIKKGRTMVHLEVVIMGEWCVKCGGLKNSATVEKVIERKKISEMKKDS